MWANSSLLVLRFLGCLAFRCATLLRLARMLSRRYLSDVGELGLKVLNPPFTEVFGEQCALEKLGV